MDTNQRMYHLLEWPDQPAKKKDEIETCTTDSDSVGYLQQGNDQHGGGSNGQVE